MIAVIFEVIPHADKKQAYLDMAAEMKPLVEQIDGFLSVERFQSLTNPEKLLSVSFFRDEAALNEWRQLTQHRKAQRAGRSSYFRDYRLRVAQVVRDYGMDERDEAPADSRDVNG
ncbi:Antibiotic biosynthesis monooxygenase [Labrenzia sp. THAF191b]|uniref:antibiotic biosynthesis monooxygenase family protein n=1 Tax=unclassified Labrenzia TaxID=2648686 RepID=UPI0012689DFB|nr:MULTISPECIES: antibiotic biosynthesis monooxygenase [unclassified Labrenzia]QFS99234.1 Antibiotic biosynthesis monooxygenase [Labrenzia sp. THAF191b]QFT05548.1 Antibiotic biosynthesis monooxygenase [Labrenzia sp. THAF191a]QFT17092.1 Antibiotic biosynthesis monooxygenase [Labrenzia sp. THAF187b]